jgi:hypothetical protein
MNAGWFVGNFSPAVVQAPGFEVALKKYKAGDSEASHYHKLAIEITLIVDGEAEMCGRKLVSGDIVKLASGEVTTFRAITDVTTVVVKMPSVPGDKYSA